MYVRTKLPLVDMPHPQASILRPTLDALPLFTGGEQVDMLRGGCEAVICRSMSALTSKTKFAAPHQLVVICPRCGVNNVLPSTMHSEGGHERTHRYD